MHRWRSDLDAVAVGIGTALADDALLTARDVDRPPAQPTRVVFDSAARLPLDAKLVGSLDRGAGVRRRRGPRRRRAARRAALRRGRGDRGRRLTRERAIAQALDELGERGITSLLLEGGASSRASFRDAGEIDELRLFFAPLLLGGRPAAAGRRSAPRRSRPPSGRWRRMGALAATTCSPASGCGSGEMFTGLVKEIGEVERGRSRRRAARGCAIRLAARRRARAGRLDRGQRRLPDRGRRPRDGHFEADVMNQTLDADLARRARAAGTGSTSSPRCGPAIALGGHIVQGHVDGVAEVARAARGRHRAAASRRAAGRRSSATWSSMARSRSTGVSLTVAGARRRLRSRSR